MQKRSDFSEIIVQVKEGRLSNILCILFLLSLCAVVICVAVKQQDVIGEVVAPFFCAAWLYVGYVCFKNILNPKTCILAFEGDRLVWMLRAKESEQPKERSIPLSSIEALEFVLPATKYKNNARLHSLAELFIVDVHGNRVQLPMEIWPGINRKKITEAIRQKRPTLHVVEKLDEGD